MNMMNRTRCYHVYQTTNGVSLKCYWFQTPTAFLDAVNLDFVDLREFGYESVHFQGSSTVK